MSSHKNERNYDTWSASYDEYPNPTVARDDQTFPQLYGHLRTKNVLEVGCGTGRHTQRLVEAQCKVTAIDISHGMLQRAREKIKSPNVQFLKANFLEDEIPNGPFDAAIMSLVLEHINDLEAFFRKARGLLCLGGGFFFSEIHPERAAHGRMAHFKATDKGEIHLDSVPHSAIEIKRALENHGFRIESVRDICGSEDLGDLNSGWEKYLGKPMLQQWCLSAH